MQSLVIILLSVILCYSLVIAVPIHQIRSQTEDAKHQQAMAIAARILQEMHAGHLHQNEDELLLDRLWPFSRNPPLNDVPQPHDPHVMHWPILDEEAGPELDSFDDIFSLLDQQLLDDSAEQTDDGENKSPVIKHVSVTDDRRMNAEDH